MPPSTIAFRALNDAALAGLTVREAQFAVRLALRLHGHPEPADVLSLATRGTVTDHDVRAGEEGLTMPAFADALEARSE